MATGRRAWHVMRAIEQRSTVDACPRHALPPSTAPQFPVGAAAARKAERLPLPGPIHPCNAHTRHAVRIGAPVSAPCAVGPPADRDSVTNRELHCRSRSLQDHDDMPLTGPRRRFRSHTAAFSAVCGILLMNPNTDRIACRDRWSRAPRACPPRPRSLGSTPQSGLGRRESVCF